MKWPWRKDPENRATLTFLPDGMLILGVPHGTTDEEAHNIQKGLAEWDRNGRDKPLVIFPFPVDVVDKR